MAEMRQILRSWTFKNTRYIISWTDILKILTFILTEKISFWHDKETRYLDSAAQNDLTLYLEAP